MYCRKCGKAVGDDDKFCFNCGNLLQEESEQAEKNIQEYQVTEKEPVSIVDEEIPESIADEETLIDDSPLEENNKEEITRTDDVPDDFNPEDFTKVVKKKFCKKCDRERTLFGEKCWWCGSKLETIEHTMKLTPNEMSKKKEEIERKKRIAEQNKKKDEEKHKKLIDEQNKEREKQTQAAITTNAGGDGASIDKTKKKKRLIIILSSIAIILATIFFIGVQEQQREEELARKTLAAKKEYFTTYNEIMGHISIMKFILDLDASGQKEVFRKNSYGDLDGAVEKYREKYSSIEEGYEVRTKKIEDLINKELVKNANLLSEDAEYKKLNELLDKTISDLNSYLEDTTNPTGTYYTYTESSNEKSKKLKQSYSEMETKFKYILEANGLTLKDVKNKGKTQTNK
jgi:hypothetical protein